MAGYVPQMPLDFHANLIGLVPEPDSGIVRRLFYHFSLLN
jgi:hypothetical protein